MAVWTGIPRSKFGSLTRSNMVLIEYYVLQKVVALDFP